MMRKEIEIDDLIRGGVEQDIVRLRGVEGDSRYGGSEI